MFTTEQTMFWLWCIVLVLHFTCWLVLSQGGAKPGGGNATDSTGNATEDNLKKERERYIKKLYFPNYGFEPYWEETVKRQSLQDLKEVNQTPAGITTTAYYEACGEECSYIYMRLGKICAHKVINLDHEHECNISEWWYKQCDGYPHGNLTGFQTFDNYCRFLDAQCGASGVEHHFVFVHMGGCRNETIFYLPEVFNSTAVSERLNNYNKSVKWIVDGWAQQWEDEYAEVDNDRK